MGFFSGTTTEIVTSVIYNLAGDNPPESYIRSVVSGHIVMQRSTTMGETIQSGLMNGPGLRLKQFVRWANGSSGYAAAVGSPVGSVSPGDAVDEDALKDSLPHGSTETVVLDYVSTGAADISFWADAYMQDNHPDEVSGGYVVDYSPTPGYITITLPNSTVYTVQLVGYNAYGQYLYVAYHVNPLIGSSGPTKTLIYQRGTGNALYDSFFSGMTSLGGFLPHIPVRVRNRFISDTYLPALYPLVKQAMKKSLPNGNFDKLVKDLTNNNPSLGDIDHATIVFGVSLATPHQDGLRYIYEFFRSMLISGYGSMGSIMVASGTASLPFSIKISWEKLTYTTSPGQIFPGAKVGATAMQPAGLTTHIRQQIGANQIGTMSLYALAYVNIVYDGKRVIAMPGTANATSEDYEKIVVPLNTRILQDLSLMDANQLGNYVGYMIFHCYDKVKTRWYENGLLNLALMVVTVAVAVVSAGAGAGASGALGSVASIGAALGFSGVLAIVVGGLANAVASMLVMRILQTGATAVFGEQVGMIVGTIAGMVAMSYGTSYLTNQPMSGVLTELSQPANLLKLSSSVGDGYSKYLQGNLAEINEAMASLAQESEKLYSQMDEMYASLRGNSLNVVNPLNFTDVLSEAGESRNSFLQRTLMTGPEIAQSSLQMLEQYAELSLSLDLP